MNSNVQLNEGVATAVMSPSILHATMIIGMMIAV